MENINAKKLLNKINTINVTDQVFNMIQEQIISETWPQGTKIPSENDLCDIMGVSRVSVRAAIQKLIALGLLEVKKGEGTFVKKFSLTEYLGQISPLMFKGKNLDEIKQFRYAMEAECVKTAINIYKKEEIDQLIELVTISENAYKVGNVEEYLEYDYNFHRYLYKMSHNSILIMMFDAFSDAFFNISTTNLKSIMSKSRKDNISQHIELAEAIRAKDYDLAMKNISKIIFLT